MDMDAGLERFLNEPHKEMAYATGYGLRGFNVTYKADTVLLVVKVVDRDKGGLVAFIEAEDMIDCFWYLYQSLTKTNAPLKYHVDKYFKV